MERLLKSDACNHLLPFVLSRTQSRIKMHQPTLCAWPFYFVIAIYNTNNRRETALQGGSVASLGLVSPRAASGASPLFIFLWKTDDLFCSSVPLFVIHSGVNPLRLSPLNFFYLSDLVCPLFFVNLPIFFSFRCHPPGGCHPGRITADHWRQAQRRGHQRGEGTLRPTMATRRWWFGCYNSMKE